MGTNHAFVLGTRHADGAFPSEDVADDEVPSLDFEDALVPKLHAYNRLLDEESLAERADADLLIELIRDHIDSAPLKFQERANRHPIDPHSANPSISRCRYS